MKQVSDEIGGNIIRGFPRKSFGFVLNRWRDPYLMENSFYHGHFRVGLASSRWSPVIAPGAPGSPSHPKKIGSGARDHSGNALECSLDPSFHPVIVKITKNYFWGDFGPKKVPKWALRAAGWDPQSPSKIDWVKYQLSISSKNPPTLGGWGSRKCA